LAAEPCIFIVDDDPSVRDSLGLMLSVKGYHTALFASGEDFLKAWRAEWSGCLLIDLRMPGIDGLTLQQSLLERDCHLPVIIMTGHGDAASARQAFKAFASDFLEKPLDDENLVEAITEALRRQELTLGEIRHREQLAQALRDLTPREREVMDLVVRGRHNREIAPALGISARTVEAHKSHLMAKLNAGSVADLVRISMLGSHDPK